MSGGVGDCLMGIKPALFLKNQNVEFESFVRDEVYNPLNYIFKNSNKYKYINIRQNSEKEKYGSNYNLFEKEFLPPLISKYEEIYYNIPDFLYRNPHAFNWKKYNLHPQTVLQQRIFIDDWKPNNKIYLALNSSTQGYTPPHLATLIKMVAEENPDKEVIYPLLKSWAGIELQTPEKLTNPPSNLTIIENPDLLECIDLVKQSELVICTDNLLSHASFEYGIPRILLDPQRDRNLFTARWRENLSESIPINSSPKNVAILSKTLLDIPQVCLIPREKAINWIGAYERNFDWSRELNFKW